MYKYLILLSLFCSCFDPVDDYVADDNLYDDDNVNSPLHRDFEMQIYEVTEIERVFEGNSEYTCRLELGFSFTSEFRNFMLSDRYKDDFYVQISFSDYYAVDLDTARFLTRLYDESGNILSFQSPTGGESEFNIYDFSAFGDDEVFYIKSTEESSRFLMKAHFFGKFRDDPDNQYAVLQRDQISCN